MLIFHILFVDNLNAEQLFCGSSYKPSLFLTALKKEPLPTRNQVLYCCIIKMADEPSESVAQATQAHECSGAREGSPCSYLSESDAAIIDGATEK